MKSTLLITTIIALYCCTIADAQDIDVPHWLTCERVNYTYIDYYSNGPWSSVGKYWLDVEIGDNKSFFTAQNFNSPYILLRVNNGLPPGSTSTDALIRPWDKFCSTSNGHGLASIYSYFQVNGTYLGVQIMNGLDCDTWYAELGSNPPSKYWLWVTVETFDGIQLPIRHVAIEATGIPFFPTQTMVMDFSADCKGTYPPPSTFTIPAKCPPVHAPASFPPKPKVFPPPGMLKAKQILENIQKIDRYNVDLT